MLLGCTPQEQVQQATGARQAPDYSTATVCSLATPSPTGALDYTVYVCLQ